MIAYCILVRDEEDESDQTSVEKIFLSARDAKNYLCRKYKENCNTPNEGSIVQVHLSSDADFLSIRIDDRTMTFTIVDKEVEVPEVEAIRDHIDFLKERLIPDLYESGTEATAEDFEKCCEYMKLLTE